MEQSGSILHSLLDRIGNTPLFHLQKVNPYAGVRILAKLELHNPSGSPKDRIAKSMIEEAEKRGDLRPGMTIIEATTGSTGIALSMVAAIKGYKMLVVMPRGMSEERKKMMKAYGAEIIYTEGAGTDMDEGVQLARKMAKEHDDYWMANQFSNPDNTKAHIQTGNEIWEQTGGDIDAFVASFGTAGLLMGVAQVLKEKKPSIKIVTTEPTTCALLSGGSVHPHKIEGISDGFVPDLLHRDMIDEVITISDEESMNMAREIAKKEGIFCGSSSGINVCAALKVAEKMGKGTVVTILPDRGERYFSTDLCKEPLS